ncbi:MAG: hypothetical protein JSU82_12865 [Rhodospirillales bacterium]|nr:MAG: hypothetical protein JSU82_12865 [Rhodospirillales bacterium]
MSRTAVALALSFLIYLVPIVHVHGGTLLGIYLWVMLVEGRGEFEPQWIALNLALAIALQAAWATAFRWILSGTWLRWLLVAGFVPATAVTVVVMYLLVIPTLFLIEADDRPEIGTWPVACSVPDASIAGLPTGVTLALERAGEVWIHSADGGYAVLSQPDCSIDPRKLFFPGVQGSIGFVGPGGAALYRMDADGDRQFEYWYLDRQQSAPRRIEAPSDLSHWAPLVDAPSRALAWLETRRGADRQVVAHIIAVRTLPDGPTLSIPLQIDRVSNPRLVDFDLAAGYFVILRNYREIIRVGPDGLALAAPLRPPGFDSVGANVRLLDGGWVAWDGYREKGRYRLAWSLPRGSGIYEIPKGRGIMAVSADPAGRYIAISVSGTLSIGSVEDSVRVVRVRDGAEVWRRYLPRYTRGRAAFLGSDRLAVTVVDGSDIRTDVLRLPAP